MVGDEAARTAVASGDTEWLRARHAEGTFVNPIRWDGGGLLTVAVRENRPEILALLLDFGFDPNERISEGEGDWVAYSQAFPLWACAALGRPDLAEMLLARGADPNAHVDSSGSSVHSAYSHKQWEMVELLRRHGGLVTADTAAIYRQTELARQMLAEGQPVADDLLRHGACGGAVEIVRMALERFDWRRDDPRWFGYLNEPLYFWHHIPWLNAGNREFDRTSYLTCFRLILERCDANLVGNFRQNMLHEVASMRDHITDEEVAPFTQALLDAGARMDVRDDTLKSTPLGWACRWGRLAVVRLLLDRGADGSLGYCGVSRVGSAPSARGQAGRPNLQGHVDHIRTQAIHHYTQRNRPSAFQRIGQVHVDLIQAEEGTLSAGELHGQALRAYAD
jgi:ankyrin repeat protein